MSSKALFCYYIDVDQRGETAMFAPKVAKAQTRASTSSTNGLAHQRPTLMAHRTGHDAIEQAQMLQWSIGNQATLRSMAQRTSRLTANGPGEYQEPAVDRDAHAMRGLSWDFSKIPLFPPERASQSQGSSPQPDIVQAKLVVGQADDPLEHEANRIADQVLRKPASEVHGIVHDVLRSSGQPLDRAKRALSSFQARTGLCACGGTCPDCAAKFRATPTLHRCPTDASCDRDEALLQRDGYGEATCNPGLGKTVISVSEFCAGDCVRQHEQTHANDYGYCCSVYSDCWNKATDDSGRRRCYEQWVEFLAQNEDWFECNAYNIEAQCLNDFIKRNCVASGGPVSNACCQTLSVELDTATKRAANHCGKAQAFLPCTLYLKSADSTPAQPSNAIGAEGEAAGTAVAKSDTGIPPATEPS
jgi:hypothetical protein